MREIKFRGFFEGKMWEVEKINFYLETVEFKGSLGIYDIDKLHNPLMQYTGIKDKNAKDIYEGDVVNIRRYDAKLYEVGEIEWWNSGNACFGIKAIIGGIRIQEVKELEVIGNIYETPQGKG